MIYYNEEWNGTSKEIAYYTLDDKKITLEEFQKLSSQDKKRCKGVFKEKGGN